MNNLDFNRILDDIIETKEKQYTFLKIFNELIDYANTLDSSNWLVCYELNSRFRLYVGGFIVATIIKFNKKGSIWLTFDKDLLHNFSKKIESYADLVLDNNSKTQEYRRGIFTKNFYYSYNNIEVWKEIKELQYRTVRQASLINWSNKAIHSNQLLTFLKQKLSILELEHNTSKIPEVLEPIVIEEDNAKLDDVENIASMADWRKIIDIFENATPQQKEVISQQIERGVIAQKFKKLCNYECQICKALNKNPIGFLSRAGIPYIETHHVSPVSLKVKGSLGIHNLLTVCANHHRQMHYGNVDLIENINEYFKFKIDEVEIKIKKMLIPQKD